MEKDEHETALREMQAEGPRPKAPMNSPRRKVFKRISVAGLVMAILLGGLVLSKERIIDAVIRKQLSAVPDQSFLADDGKVRVLLCGTGTPQIVDASQACTLVAAGGRMFLFDSGAGTAQSLNRSSVPLGDLEHVFLTHLHSDHFNGLGTFINQRWTWGGATQLQVAGPSGTGELVRGLADAYRIDKGYRALDMPPLAKTAEAATAVAQEVDVAQGEEVRVYDSEGVTIDAVRVRHDPVDPAFGYIVRFNGKKIFISGDTIVTELNDEYMSEADLVVHEAYSGHVARRGIKIMRELGKNADADIAELTPEYHSDTVDLARQAERVGARHLALTHLIPYPEGFIARRMFVAGMSDEFDGKITVGSDGKIIVV